MAAYAAQVAEAAKLASRRLATAGGDQKDRWLHVAAGLIRARTGEVLAVVSVRQKFNTGDPDSLDTITPPRTYVMDKFTAELTKKLRPILAARGAEEPATRRDSLNDPAPRQ